MSANLDDMLAQLQLDATELVNRLRATFAGIDPVTRGDEPVPLDHLVPTTAFPDGTEQPHRFHRTTVGFALLQGAGAVGGSLVYSLDQLPYGAMVLGCRLIYTTDATWPGGDTLALVDYVRRTGVVTSQQATTLPPAAPAGEPKSVALRFAKPVTVASGQPGEKQILVSISNAVDGSSMYVRGLHVTYVYYPIPRAQ